MKIITLLCATISIGLIALIGMIIMTTFTRRKIFSLILTVLAFAGATAQSTTLIKEKSSVSITGTSSLHDWHESVGDYTIKITFAKNDGTTPAIEKVAFIATSSSVTSDNKIMTDKTLNALQAKEYPEITFISTGSSTIVISEGNFTSNVTGDLNLNGVTKRLSIPLRGSYSGDKLEINASQKLKMSDYQIKSPTAMLGTLKTGDEVTVHLDLKFDISSNN